ncbi:MAG: hypothetical protein GWO24_12360, partial [Akkermansiaceae bacterium]|nr:hypothetical protein [Akkermansiaceae bacterium]
MQIVFPESSGKAVIGGKAAALLDLRDAGLPIPGWFVVPPGTRPSGKSLAAALRELGPGPYAVRSSAAAEDGLEHSYAGQFESFLGIAAHGVADRIAEVRASGRSPHLAEYCREHKLPDPGEPAVIVQRMIDAAFAGVAFSADPVSGRRRVCVVSAVSGWGDKLVSGEAEGETWRLDDGGRALAAGSLLSTGQTRAVAALARRCEA